MPYCPKCRDEFRPGFDWCPDCQVSLVDTLPEPEPQTEVPLQPVPLINVEDNSQFALISGLLREAGIPFYALDQDGGSYLRLVMGFSVYDQMIYVNQSDYAAAIVCLDAYYTSAPDGLVFNLTEEQEREGEEAQQAENDSYRGFLWFLAVFGGLVLLLWMSMR